MSSRNRKKIEVQAEPSVIPFCYSLMAKAPVLEAANKIIGVSTEIISAKLGQIGCSADCDGCVIKSVVEKGAEVLEATGGLISDLETEAIRPIRALYKAAESFSRIGDN